MASLLLATVAQAAISTATMAVTRLLTPDRDIQRTGPRLDDLSVHSSALGTPVPFSYGRHRSAGNVIWSTGLIETEQSTSEKVGGKGGGQTVTQTSYSYSASFAIALGDRPIVDMGRIWADGKLIREADGDLSVPGTWRLYRGGEDQAPDALIEASEGADRTPAFRGLVYAVFEDLALADFGNRLPNLTFEVIADGHAPSLGTIAADLAARVGVALVPEPGAAPSVEGAFFLGGDPARATLSPLLALAPVTLFSRLDNLVLRPEPSAPVATLPRDRLDARPAGDPGRGALVRHRPSAARRPLEMELRYADPQRDYQPGVQRAVRPILDPGRRETLDAPLVMTAGQAKHLAAERLARIWRAGDEIRMTGGWALLAFEPGDRLMVADRAGTAQVDMIVQQLTTGPGLVEIVGRSVANGGPLPQPQADPGIIPAQAVLPVGETLAEILDLPLLPGQSDSAAAFTLFAAVTGASQGWRGASLLVSDDQGASYQSMGSTGLPAVMGETIDTLALGPADVWDEMAFVTVRLWRPDQMLESRSADAVLNGANLLLIGDELVQFRSAELLDSGHIRLSGLLRGRRGTEDAIAGHGSGERVVLIDRPRFVAATLATGRIGRPALVKAVSVNQSAEAVDPVIVTPAGRALLPLSPVHVRALRHLDGTWQIGWTRRTRLGGDWLDGADVPLGEEREAYQVTLSRIDGGGLRTVTVAGPALTYTLSDQMADAGAGQTALAIRVRQISAVAGPGTAAAMDVTAP